MSPRVSVPTKPPDLSDPADCRIALMRTSPVPLWAQIAELFVDAITASRMAPGQSLGAELALADRFNVSRITIRRALADLYRRGLIVRSKGRGTYVRQS